LFSAIKKKEQEDQKKNVEGLYKAAFARRLQIDFDNHGQFQPRIIILRALICREKR